MWATTSVLTEQIFRSRQRSASVFESGYDNTNELIPVMLTAYLHRNRVASLIVKGVNDMPDKMLRPENFERPSRTEHSETKDFTAERIDFRPTPTTERPSWKPDQSDRPANLNEWMTVDSATFHNSPVHARPTEGDRHTISARSHSETVIRGAVLGEYIYAIIGQVLGFSTVIGGIILALHGVSGHTSWTAKLFGFESSINDAAPGVVLFIVGIFLVFITRPKVKLGDLKG
jgi:hypothetical protein